MIMAYKADNIKEGPQANIQGVWVLARPVVACLKNRIKDAWGVLIGKYDAIKWYRQ